MTTTDPTTDPVGEVRAALDATAHARALQETCDHDDTEVPLSPRLALKACRRCGRQSEVYTR